MYGVDNFHIVKFIAYLPNRAKDIFHILTKIFTPVAGNRNYPFIFKVEFFKRLLLKFIRLIRNFKQRVDHSITRYENICFIYALTKQIFLVAQGRRKVNVRNVSGENSVHFLRKRRIFVICAQSCFHMTHAHLMIKR